MKFRMIGHRGNPSQNPENTIVSFISARKCGVYGIETDIQITADQKIVIFHDEDLKRLTGMRGKISDFPLSELKEINVLGSDQKIPTLEEFLESTGDVTKYIELKTRNEKAERINDGLEKRLHEYFKGNYSDNIYFISFDVEAIRKMKEYDKRYRVGLDIGNETSFIWDSMLKDHIPEFLDLVIPQYDIIKKETRDLEKYAEKIIPWVINSSTDLEKLEEMGIYSFMTDTPCSMKNFIE